MSTSKRRKVLLTFDVEGIPPKEDSLDRNSLMCLRRTLDVMNQHNFKGIFFITGRLAEQLSAYPDVIEKLSQHRIGYHGSSHERSLPIIQRTDVPDYRQAVESSVANESATENVVDPAYNLQTLRNVFPNNNIDCFRAPFLAWTPPYLEALRTYGIKFDFSSYISDTPVTFKGITFYPGPITIDESLATFVTKADPRSAPRPLLSLMLQRNVSVLHFHPSSLLFHRYLYSRGGKKLRGETQVKLAMSVLQFLYKRMRVLHESGLLEVTSSLSQNWRVVRSEDIDVGKVYSLGIRNAVNHFNYHPRFILPHFMRFFDRQATAAD